MHSCFLNYTIENRIPFFAENGRRAVMLYWFMGIKYHLKDILLRGGNLLWLMRQVEYG